MGRRPRVDVFCEDSGHEQFARALIARLGREEGAKPVVRDVSARGGQARALLEFRAWQRAVAVGRGLSLEIPDLLVLVIDANCRGWTQVRRELESAIDHEIFPHFAIGCPDPHVERWCLADPEAITEVLDTNAPADPGKCERDLYKQLLRKTILAAGQPILTSEMEYAPDLVAAMRLYHAGKNQPSLRHFIDEIRRAFRRLAAATESGR